MVWNSVRMRLTLWNVLVLALVLGGFGTALCYSVQANQSASIDRDLAQRARGFMRGPGRDRFGRRGGPSGERHWAGPDRPSDAARSPRPSPSDPGRNQADAPAARAPREQRSSGPPDAQRSAGSSSSGRGQARTGGPPSGPLPAGPAPNGPGPEPPPPPPDQRGYFHRPRLFDLQGKSWGGRFPDDRPWDPATFHLSAGGREQYSTVTVDGERVRVFSAPMRRDGTLVGVVQVALPIAERERLVQSQVKTLLMLFPLALLIAGLGGLILTNHGLQPVRKVTQAAAQISAEDLSRRLEVTGKDEFAHLALTFNGMIARLEEAFRGQEEAYRKLESAYEQQRRFTGDASHELRTPLARIKACTSLALCSPASADDYREALVLADQTADVMSRIVQDLLLLARSDAGQLSIQLQPTPVEEVLMKAVSSLPAQPGAPIHLEIPPVPLQVQGNAGYLTQVLVNLLDNALRHTPADGQITLSAELVASEGHGDTGTRGHGEEESLSAAPSTRSTGTRPLSASPPLRVAASPQVLIRVQDTGEGIPPEHLPHVCERFYRVEAARTRAGGGTGLGLAICRSIIEAHGGTLSIQSQPGKGTTVQISIPSAGEPITPPVQVEAFA
jgi:signal transduction histidine kinase